MKRTRETFVLSVAAALISGCAAPRPIDEYNLAKVAIDAAREAGAPSLAPNTYSEALAVYEKGVRAFDERYNKEAKRLF